eukprot:EG_transcript_10895
MQARLPALLLLLAAFLFLGAWRAIPAEGPWRWAWWRSTEPRPVAREMAVLLNRTWSTAGPPIPVLGVAAFANTALLLRLLNSIDYHVQRVVIIHNGQHPDVTALVELIRQQRPSWLVESHPENLGCAGSWNHIIEAVPGAPYYVICNDDIAFRPGALRRFALGTERQRARVRRGESNRVVLYPTHGKLMWRSPIWSCYALLREAVEAVGPFDTNLWPAYHEDYDYMVRLARAGLWQTLLADVEVLHGWKQGQYRPGTVQAVQRQPHEAVLQEYSRQQLRHERGNPYYALKWGLGERMGFYDEREGDWNRSCSGRGRRRVCTPQPSRLYAHPFNDPSLPLSFVRFDPQLRRCIQFGDRPPCRYNVSLLPHPDLVPHDVFVPAARRWRRHGKPIRISLFRWG